KHKFKQINKTDFIEAGESDSEEIENFLNDDSIPIGVENFKFNMEEYILFLERLLSKDPSPPPPMIPNQTKSSIEEHKYSFSMGYKHFSTTLVTKEFAKSGTKNLVSIPHECEVTSDDGRRPFLSTAHAIINVHEREIILREDKQSLTIQCGDSLSIKKHKFKQINKTDFIEAGESDSEEIENFLNDDSIPIGVENFKFNMEEDILFLERLLSKDPSPPPPMIPN
nr:hypothetical protein [Tanacetum cinerariifolium]